ncbi:hypothetical protein Tco_1144093 [Tanacetum coccineum]
MYMKFHSGKINDLARIPNQVDSYVSLSELNLSGGGDDEGTAKGPAPTLDAPPSSSSSSSFSTSSSSLSSSDDFIIIIVSPSAGCQQDPLRVTPYPLPIKSAMLAW